VRRFLERIGRAAPAVAEDPAGLVPIGKASEKAKCPAVEIVHLILGGFLNRVVRLDGEHGLAALRVDPAEVKSMIGDVMIGLSPGEAFNQLRIPNRSGWHLVERGELPAITIRCPDDRHRFHRFRHDDVADVASRLASLAALAEITGRPAHEIARTLKLARIKPAVAATECGANLFRLRDTERALA